MDFATWNSHSFVLLFVRLFLSIVFFVSAIDKVRQFQQFTTTITAYRLLPETWSKSLAFTITGTEISVSVLLFMGWQSQIAAFVSIFMLFIFSIAMGINLIRGRTNLECGCSGAKHAQKISLGLVGRNIALSMVAASILVWGGGLIALDNLPFWGIVSGTEQLLPIGLVLVGASCLTVLFLQLIRLLMMSSEEE